MVFVDINTISGSENGLRIIIYYVKDNLNYTDANYTSVFERAETALALLKKKNDDVLLIEVPYNSNQFKHFVDLYKPEITEPVTLFAVNNEGIPLIRESISEELNISNAIEKLCTACNLKDIPKSFVKSKEKSINVERPKSVNDSNGNISGTSFNKYKEESSVIANTPTQNKQAIELTSHRSKLHIRLPNGAREEVQFDNVATLQEVWITISTKFNIKDFDLKTYDHPIFSEDDYEKTLQDLELCPRGVLIVVTKNASSHNNNGGIIAVFQFGINHLFSLSTQAVQYMQGLLFMFWNFFFPSSNSNSGRQEDTLSNSSSVKSSSQGRSRKYVSKNNSNIHTLRRNDESDDENNRYNGNSTQQK